MDFNLVHSEKGVHLCKMSETTQSQPESISPRKSSIREQIDERKQSRMEKVMKRPSVLVQFQHRQSAAGLNEDEDDAEEDEADGM